MSSRKDPGDSSLSWPSMGKPRQGQRRMKGAQEQERVKTDNLGKIARDRNFLQGYWLTPLPPLVPNSFRVPSYMPQIISRTLFTENFKLNLNRY